MCGVAQFRLSLAPAALVPLSLASDAATAGPSGIVPISSGASRKGTSGDVVMSVSEALSRNYERGCEPPTRCYE